MSSLITSKWQKLGFDIFLISQAKLTSDVNWCDTDEMATLSVDSLFWRFENPLLFWRRLEGGASSDMASMSKNWPMSRWVWDWREDQTWAWQKTQTLSSSSYKCFVLVSTSSFVVIVVSKIWQVLSFVCVCNPLTPVLYPASRHNSSKILGMPNFFSILSLSL